MSIDWFISVLTDDGYTIFESDAVVEYTIKRRMGEYIVEVDAFEIVASRRVPGSPLKWETRTTPARFDENSSSPWMRLLFAHVAQDLETDPDFVHHVLDREGTPYQDPNAEHRLGAFELL